jgi:hypothetical protein
MLDKQLDPQVLACIIQQLENTEAGSFRAEESYGPGINDTDTYVTTYGDGTALVQRRTRSCDSCDEGSLPWEYALPERCDIALDQEAATRCEELGTDGCAPFWLLENCEVDAGATCGDLELLR